MAGSLHEDHYKFMIISRLVLLKIGSPSDKMCRENQNTHCIFNNVFKELAVREIMWKNIAEPDIPHDNMAHVYYMLDK